ncbi:hypothetical protein LJC60_09465 [Ruminococcaceae bacterium OttesenSCG-928-D13]|nr:hypothetical protein [Ruminococcaceae bacterium OttesenSCG-928-D13]
MAAGKVTISTELDNAGFESGAKRLNSNAGSFAKNLGNTVSRGATQARKALSDLKAAIGSVFSGKGVPDGSRAYESARQKVDEVGIAIESVKQQMAELEQAALSSDTATSKSFENARTRVDQTKLALDNLLSKMDEISNTHMEESLSLGMNKDAAYEVTEMALESDAAYQKLGRQYDALALKLEQQKIAMQAAKEAAVGSSGAQSSEYKRLEKQLTSLQVKQDQYRSRMEAAAKAAGNTAKTTKKATDENKKYAASAKTAGTAVGGLMQRVVKLSTMLQLMLIRRALQALITAIRDGVRDLAQVSAPFNSAMSSMKTQMLQVRNAATAAFAPALQALQPVFTMITNAAITALNTLAALNAVLFGNSSTFYRASSAAVDYASSVAGAGSEAKKANGQLAAFDDLNVLNKSEDSSGGAGGGAPAPEEMFEEVEVPGWIQDLGGKIKDFFAKVVEAAEPARQALARLWEQLKVIGGFAWAALQDFYSRFLVPVGSWVLGTGLPRLIDALRDGLAKVDWGKINTSLAKLWDALAPFAINIGEGLLWFWETILVPFGTWVLNDAIPVFLDLLSGAVGILNGVLTAARNVLEWLWNTFLQPIAEWTGGVIITVLEGLAAALTAISDWISNNLPLVEALIVVVGSFVAAWALVNAAVTIWNAIGGIATAVTTAFGAAVTFLTSPITLVALAIGALIAIIILCIMYWDEIKAAAQAVWEAIVGFFSGLAQWFSEKVVEPIKKFFTNLWDSVKTAASKAWEFIKGVWNIVATWFDSTIIQPVTRFFTGMWDGIKGLAGSAWEGIKGAWNSAASWFNNTIVKPIADFFGGLWNGIKSGGGLLVDFISDHVVTPIVDAFKFLYNGVVGIIEGIINGFVGIINGFVSGINSVIGVINMIPGVALPDIPQMPTVNIPRLAAGAVIPPNREFLAILGDQKSGTNIEAPLETIMEAMRMTLAEFGGGKDVTIRFAGNLAELVRLLKPYIDKENSRVGGSLIMGGVR